MISMTRKSDAAVPGPIVLVGVNGHDHPTIPTLLSQNGLASVEAKDLESALAECARAPQARLAIVDLESKHFEWPEVLPALESACAVLAVASADTKSGVAPSTNDIMVRPLEEHAFLERVRDLLARADADRSPRPLFLGLRTGAMRHVIERIAKLAPTDATILLRGETGTGKELFARKLHDWSRRRSGPFFSVDCAALTDSLLSSELFGHERGAFTGAVRRKRGLVELAEHGTLFLDEVGELSVAMQVKLLRLLQEREFMRVGGEEVLRCDVRIVAATHRPLEQMVAHGAFRQDLYYRLQVVPIRVPPLRERKADLAEFARYLLERLAAKHARVCPSLGEASLRQVLAHKWPGNVRELENVLERALLLGGGEIAALDLDGSGEDAGGEAGLGGLARAGQQSKRDYLVGLLMKHHGCVKSAASEARVDRRTLYRHLQSLHIDPHAFRAGRAQMTREEWHVRA
jgi:DNA-binding NtrC family response regulator